MIAHRSPLPIRVLSIVLLAIPAAAFGDDPFTGPEARRHPPKERTVDVEHMRITLRVWPSQGRIRGKVDVSFRPLQDKLREFALDCADLEVQAVRQPDGKPYRFRQVGDRLVVECDPPLGREMTVTVSIEYEGAPRRGLYFVGPDEGYPEKPRQVFSQGEPEDNRYWIPCHDYPNDRATSEMIVSVPRPYMAISNGKLIEVKDDGDLGTRTFHWKEDVPHVSYLISLVVGEYATIEEDAGGVPIITYVPRRDIDIAPNSFSKTAKMVKFFADRIGLPFPYEKYGQVTVYDFMWGGMENISVTTLTQRTLHPKRSRPIADSDGLVAHELAHQWWGDLLTCRSWAHVWLNEGFATYFTSLWFEEELGVDEFLYKVRGHQKAYLDEDSTRYRRPVVQDVFTDPIDLFDAHSYQKGACILHMLRFVVGDDGFWSGIRLYAGKHQRGLVETDDLRQAFEEATGKNLEVFFRQWLHRPGHPKFRVEWDWDAETSMAEVRVSQVQSTDGGVPIFETPVAIELTTDREAKTYRVRIRDRDQVFYLPAPSRPRMVRFDKEGWLLKEVEFEKGKEEILYQLANDGVIGRLLAIEMLGALNPFEDGYDALGKVVVVDPFWGVRVEAARALGTWGGKRGVDYLSRATQDDDPRVRKAAVEALGRLKDPRALSTIRSVYAGDANDYVEAEAALALGGFPDEGIREDLIRGLKRPSHQDVIRTNIVTALGNLEGEDLLQTLLAETEYGKPPPSRVAAIWAIREAARNDRSVRDRIVDLLRDPHIWARGRAADVLGEVGDASVVQELQDLIAREADGRIRERARQAIRKVEEREGADGREDRIEAIEKERDDLKRRLEELEAELAKQREKEGKGEDRGDPIETPGKVPVGAGKE